MSQKWTIRILKKNFDDTTNTKLLEVCLFYFYSSSLKKELIIFGVTCVLGRPCAVRSKIRYLRNLFANYRIPNPKSYGKNFGFANTYSHSQIFNCFLENKCTTNRSTMVDFLTLLQSTFRKFQLKYEIVVLDIDINNRQRKFGVDVYDLIYDSHRKAAAATAAADADEETAELLVRLFKQAILVPFPTTIEHDIKISLAAVCRDVLAMEKKNVPDVFIKRRKEEFGVSIWPIIVKTTLSIQETLEQQQHDILSVASAAATDTTIATPSDFVTTAMTGLLQGTASTINKVVGKSISSEERKVQQCVIDVKQDIKLLIEQRQEKVISIETLVSGGTTLECQGCY